MKNRIVVTPYQRLRTAALKFLSRVKFPRKTMMWVYPKERISTGWNLSDLAERVQAAEQLGHDVKLVWNKDHGLEVYYVERPGELEVTL